MLTLEHISKTYSTRSRRKVAALSDVSLNLPAKGLCLVSGQSGCGKTTLLNILGGLDSRFEGTYRFDGKPLGEDDFADFRKDYVSFIFQDFNLIDDFTVAENLSLGYTFLEEDNSQQIEKVLQQVGLENYSSRYPSELSGGEQQRVAVARALLKNSKLLLADEPTGNLDSQNAVDIYELLKQISRNILVVVVSHDRELGQKYCDFQICLERGKIVSDTSPAPAEEPPIVAPQRQAQVISNATAFQMAKHEYSYKKGKSIATTVLMAICFFVLMFSLVCWQFDGGEAIYKYIKKCQPQYIRVSQGACARSDYYDWVEQQFAAGIELFPGSFSSRQEAEACGIEFYDYPNTMELSPEIYYVSDYRLDGIIETALINFYKNGKLFTFDRSRHTYQDLIGATIAGTPGVIGGVYHDYNDYTNKDLFLDRFPTEITYTQTVILSEQAITITSNGQSITPRKISVGDVLPKVDSDVYAIAIDTDGTLHVFGGKDMCGFYSLLSNDVYLYFSTYQGLVAHYYSTSSLFDVTYDQTTQSLNWSTSFVPQSISDLTVSIFDSHTQNTVTWQNLSVRGVVMFVRARYNPEKDKINLSEEDMGVDGGILTANAQVLQDSRSFIEVLCQNMWVKVSSIAKLKRFCSQSVNSGMDGPANPLYIISSPLNQYSFTAWTTIIGLRLAASAIALPLLIATLFALDLTVSAQIRDRKREIAIFKALGAKNKDIHKIYIYEILLILIPLIVGSILLTWGATALVNLYLKLITKPLFVWLTYRWYDAPLTIAVATVFVGIATAAPLRQINKTNVIDALHNNWQVVFSQTKKQPRFSRLLLFCVVGYCR